MKQWVLRSPPTTTVQSDNFALQEAAVPTIGAGEVLLKTLYLGVAPVMLRYLRNETAFERPLKPGEVMIGRGVARVLASNSPNYQAGDIVQCKLGWREYAVIDDDPYYLPYKMRHTDLPLSYGVSSLAMSGFTALLGMRDICMAQPGERTLVSGAAGGVGSQTGFIAKALGCEPLVGIAGGAEKCRLLTERLGYDIAIDYKNEPVEEKLDEYFPHGIDVFFDNVGGPLLDMVLARIRRRARIAICGRMSEYLKEPREYHRPRNMHRIAVQDAKMEGFFIYDYCDQYRQYEDTIAQWIRSGQFRPLEDILHGIEEMPRALMDLYAGKNTGVRVVRISDDTEGA